MLKSEVYQACKSFIISKIDAVRFEIKDAQDASNAETKSTAGDKHETGRAMAQLENERLNAQLAQWLQTQTLFAKIDPSINSTIASLGSLIETDKHWFYLSVGLGSVKYNNLDFFAIGLSSPVGAGFIGKKVGDELQQGKMTYKILSIQ